ncbi:antitoxin [Kribbella antibiotica]|uniref:Antitoxin n=1 Tax=Kribbella antibiotica TaxID=190195 RepID=A0A4R4YT81_9ACTN|nr:antitoxin [Kribbella antibiotica]TDD48466.1 antitoxin [Kribbella antibiotica]
MNEFQEQAKNWLRNVVKQSPDKIKAGVEKAGDLIDQQTGGKYAAKVDAVQEKVGTFVDKQAAEPGAAPADAAPEPETAETPNPRTVGGEPPAPSAQASAGSTPEGAETGGTATGLPGPRE